MEFDQNDLAGLIQQSLANFDYTNATLLAEELLSKQDSEENKGLLADCYLAQQENDKAYSLLKNCTSSLNAYKFAVACIRLDGTKEAETALTREASHSGHHVPNGAYGLQLLANVYEKQNKISQAKEYYEKALESNPNLISARKKLKTLGQGSEGNVQNNSNQSGSDSQGLVKDGSGIKIEEILTEKKSCRAVNRRRSKKKKVVAQVDERFSEEEEDCEVYVSEEGGVYSRTMNKRVENSHYMYSILQLIQSKKNQGTYFVWNRWGKVGYLGEPCLFKFENLPEAIQKFEEIYDEAFEDDYTVTELEDYEEENEESPNEDLSEIEEESKVDIQKSGLPKPVEDLIELIFDYRMMSDQMKKIGYDPSRMPLGKLSKNAMQKAYEVLNQVAQALKNQRPSSEINELSSRFYSYIPNDFGFRPMSEFILNTEAKVKEKLEMLASLEDVQIAIKLLESANVQNAFRLLDSANKDIDRNYRILNCALTPCEKYSEEFNMVLDYMKNTHAMTHCDYKLELLDLFSVKRQGEAERFTKNLHNKQLLWYGSRITNYAGILSQGLKIAPPEAPVTAYTFGKGVYFGDMVSNSANYCFVDRQNSTGILLLCEVALGDCNEKLRADSDAANLPSGKHSTKGFGRVQPNTGGSRIIDGDVVVPMGQEEDTGFQGSGLLYNEYVVYDIKQIKIRYLVKVKFNYP